MFGFYKIAISAPKLFLANPIKNAKEMVSLINSANDNKASIILFPELSIIGYSVGDLIFQTKLLSAQDEALEYILNHSKDKNIISIIGYALKFQDRLYNTALIIKNGKILGAIPKIYLANKQEFYEGRYFNSGKEIENLEINILNQNIPFGVNLIFSDNKYLKFGVEICEDLWAITPPSNNLASNGANLIFNLSASNDIIGKNEYRLELVKTQSARTISAYIYASSSIGESGSETIFSGDLIAAEYGSILARDKNLSFDSKLIYTTVDLQRVSNLRLIDSSYNQSKIGNFKVINIENINIADDIQRIYNPHPFIPSANKADEVCKEITDIQAFALIRRLNQIGIKKVVLGISGGLDSTLALLSTHKAFKIANFDTKDIICYTMPGFGTTSQTLNSAINLCNALDVTLKEVDIKNLALQEFEAIGHNANIHDITYENVQARIRTSILMNSANKLGAIVVGTGDLSEIALGWSTYNGDHMSMYNINSSIPKTLIKTLIEYFAKDKTLKPILEDILNRPISPELLPNKDDKITQETEEIIGPYELHDFFLYHFLKEGFSPKKILYIAQIAFKNYDKETIKRWLIVFIKRFFTQQFKRDAMPNGVMVGTISLSPRSNWRMPSDADFEDYIKDLKEA